MRILSLLLFLSISVPAFSQCWNLVWADEFNGTTLNTNNWNYDTGCGWSNGELQAYTNSTNNVSVSSGTLKITARAENNNGCAYTSGRIQTRYKIDYQYGKFEARLKLPQGQGLWPAFWLMPTEGWSSKYSEIDILEVLGHQPAVTYGTSHAGVWPNLVSYNASYALPSGTFASDFHLVSVEWTPTYIKWFVDGVNFHTVLKSQYSTTNWKYFQRDFFVILNLAVGGNWPGNPNTSTVFPSTMEVDYVRIYQLNSYIKIHGKSIAEPTLTSATYSVPAFINGTYQWTCSPDGQVIAGNTPNECRFLWSTTGTKTINCTFTNACGTKTIQKTVEVTPNQWLNPSFEQLYSEWEYSASQGAAATWVTTTASPQHLTRAAKVTVTAVGANPWFIQLNRKSVSVEQGVLYKLKFWAKANLAGKKLKVNFIHPTNYTVYGTLLSTLNNTWTEYIMTFTAPYTGDLLFTTDLGFNTGTYYLDNFTFGRASLLPVSDNTVVESLVNENLLEYDNESIDFYPNPTTDFLYFNTEKPIQYKIYNVTGLIEKEGISQDEIDVQNLANGFYFLVFKDENKNIQKYKFVKE